MIRLIVLWLFFLKYRITHRKINYKGFSIICSLSGGRIAIGGDFVILKLLKEYVRFVPTLHHCSSLWR